MSAKKLIRYTVTVAMIAAMVAADIASAKPLAQQTTSLNSVDFSNEK
jgi:hypothetical protein